MGSPSMLPRMTEVSRNCVVTQKIAAVLGEKLTQAERRDFFTWLNIVREENSVQIQRERRRYG